ncbi:hypothetical protein ACP4OV_024703 [Aristida adscensionis]
MKAEERFLAMSALCIMSASIDETFMAAPMARRRWTAGAGLTYTVTSARRWRWTAALSSPRGCGPHLQSCTGIGARRRRWTATPSSPCGCRSPVHGHRVDGGAKFAARLQASYARARRRQSPTAPRSHGCGRSRERAGGHTSGSAKGGGCGASMRAQG